MQMNKNLFSFATKELSQDAYCRWLIENWDSEYDDVRKACQVLLKSFLVVHISEPMNVIE